jgi:chaperonin cofactor prefoldin
MSGTLTLDQIDARIDQLKTQERVLKQESKRVSDSIKALRPEIYFLVGLRKTMTADN